MKNKIIINSWEEKKNEGPESFSSISIKVCLPLACAFAFSLPELLGTRLVLSFNNSPSLMRPLLYILIKVAHAITLPFLYLVSIAFINLISFIYNLYCNVNK